MRSRSTLSAVLLPAVLLVAVSCGERKALVTTGPVNITVSCPGNDVNVKMEPWEVHVSKGNPSVAYQLTPSGEVSEFILQPITNQYPWPFQLPPGANRYQSSGGKLTVHGLAGNPSVGARGHYAIDLTCTSGGVAHRIVIDPDVVIEQ